jgi:DNA invertase Pin-like site-specific DNA recombinase
VAAALDAAAKRRVDLILVWKLDRALRSVQDAATTTEQLRRVGLRPALTSESESADLERFLIGSSPSWISAIPTR